MELGKHLLSHVFNMFCQVDHLRNFIFFRMQMGFVDNIVAKCVYFCPLYQVSYNLLLLIHV